METNEITEEELVKSGWTKQAIRLGGHTSIERWIAPKEMSYERLFSRGEAQSMERTRRKADGGA